MHLKTCIQCQSQRDAFSYKNIRSRSDFSSNVNRTYSDYGFLCIFYSETHPYQFHNHLHITASWNLSNIMHTNTVAAYSYEQYIVLLHNHILFLASPISLFLFYPQCCLKMHATSYWERTYLRIHTSICYILHVPTRNVGTFNNYGGQPCLNIQQLWSLIFHENYAYSKAISSLKNIACHPVCLKLITSHATHNHEISVKYIAWKMHWVSLSYD